MHVVEANHLRNFLIWHEEDIARRDDLASIWIKKAKRSIDKLNQERNNLIEKLDETIFDLYNLKNSNAKNNSETPGMIIDRLSIMSLKAYHMQIESIRISASEKMRAVAKEKFDLIIKQKCDLERCFCDFIEEINSGTRSFRINRQLKMYNDPELNPQIYENMKSDQISKQNF